MFSFVMVFVMKSNCTLYVYRLAHGCISPRSIYWEIKQYESQRTANKSTYWVIFELIWRDYFKYVGLKYGNKIFFKGGMFNMHKPWSQDMNLFNAWKGRIFLVKFNGRFNFSSFMLVLVLWVGIHGILIISSLLRRTNSRNNHRINYL